MYGQLPPMDPTSDEADERQLDLARAQGAAYQQALTHMTGAVAQAGGSRRAGDYVVAFAVEEAEGMYEWVDDGLVWREPEDENLHVEIAVCDGADGRFVPDARVTVTLVGPRGTRIGTHEHPLLWHPMIYHYGRNWSVPGDGSYTLRVRVEPPRWPRHDRINGRRLCSPVEVEFTGVQVRTGRD